MRRWRAQARKCHRHERNVMYYRLFIHRSIPHNRTVAEQIALACLRILVASRLGTIVDILRDAVSIYPSCDISTGRADDILGDILVLVLQHLYRTHRERCNMITEKDVDFGALRRPNRHVFGLLLSGFSDGKNGLAHIRYHVVAHLLMKATLPPTGLYPVPIVGITSMTYKTDPHMLPEQYHPFGIESVINTTGMGIREVAFVCTMLRTEVQRGPTAVEWKKTHGTDLLEAYITNYASTTDGPWTVPDIWRLQNLYRILSLIHRNSAMHVVPSVLLEHVAEFLVPRVTIRDTLVAIMVQ